MTGLEEEYAAAKTVYEKTAKDYIAVVKIYQNSGLKGEELARAKEAVETLAVSLKETSKACGDLADRVLENKL